MSTRAATRCWGLAAALAVISGVACGGANPRTPKAAPALPVYKYAWSTVLDAAGPISVAVDDTHVFVASGDGIAAFNGADGAPLWNLKDVGPGATLMVADGVLYAVRAGEPATSERAASGAVVAAFDTSSGRALWRQTLAPAPVIGPLLHANTIIIGIGREVRAYAARDGTAAWQLALDDEPRGLAADGARLFVGLASASVASIDLQRHAVEWRMPVDSPATSIVSGDGHLVVSAEDGSLTAYHANRAAPLLWRVLRVDAVGPPVVAAGRLYVSQLDNTLRAYDLGNGTERWRVRLGSRPRRDVRLAAGQLFVPLLNGAVATCVAKGGDPSAEITLSLPDAGAAPPDQRLEANGLTGDGQLIFRVVRPSAFTRWTLVASRRQDPATKPPAPESRR